MSEPTQGVPPVGGPPPGPPPPGPPPSGPPDDQPDRRLIYAIAAVVGVIVLLVVVLLVVRGGGEDDDLTTGSSTTTAPDTTTATSTSTTTSTSSTTTSSTTTTEPPTSTTTSESTTTSSTTTTTTTTAPPTTIAPERCRGTSGPDDPEPVARTFYDAWTVDDRACAEEIATDDAIDTLFVIDGSDADWEFQTCEPESDVPDPHVGCAFRYEGGTAFFQLRFGAIDGWRVFDVDFQAD